MSGKAEAGNRVFVLPEWKFIKLSPIEIQAELEKAGFDYAMPIERVYHIEEQAWRYTQRKDETP